MVFRLAIPPARLLRAGLLSAALGATFAVAQTSARRPSSPSTRVQGFTPAPLDSGFGPLDTSQPSGISPNQIVTRFAAKESEFKRALDDYTYRRTVKLDTLDDLGNVDGQYLQIDDIIFNPSGGKYEKVVYAPENTLTRIAMSPADFDDIEHRLPFSLTTDDIGLYRVDYAGKQCIDQVATYVFDVTPKQMEKGKRYFTGRIWVDAREFQIVVTNGKNIPDNTKPGQEDLSVPFITYRQQIDGKYWFPVYTKAEGILHFKNCKDCLPNDVPLREIVKYEDYKRFRTNVRILYKGFASANRNTPQAQPSKTPDTRTPDIKTQDTSAGPRKPPQR